MGWALAALKEDFAKARQTRLGVSPPSSCRMKLTDSVSCIGAKRLAAGDRGLIRVRVWSKLSDFQTSPDTFVAGDIEESGDVKSIRIQHYSFLAFIRFFYQQTSESNDYR